MKCVLLRRHVGALVDGELDPATTVEFDRHVAACADCQEVLAFERMVRDSLQHAAAAEGGAPASLAERIRLSLVDAERKSGRKSGIDPNSQRPLLRVVPVPLHQMVPLAAAAAVVLVFFGSAGLDLSGLSPNAVHAAGMPIFRDVVRVHSSRLPADVRVDSPWAGEDTDEGEPTTDRAPLSTQRLGAVDPLLRAVMGTRWQPRATSASGSESDRRGRLVPRLQHFFRGKVEFPVRPARFDREDVQLVGARVSNVRERPAAALYYNVQGRRVTVVVFRSIPGLARERVRVGDRELSLGAADGYTVPVRQHEGIAYAFTGDLTRHELMELAASAQVED